MRLEWVINIPVIITMVTMIVAMIVRFVRIEDKIAELREDLKEHRAFDDDRFKDHNERLRDGERTDRDHGSRLAVVEANLRRS
jgi:hypothetical protein